MIRGLFQEALCRFKSVVLTFRLAAITTTMTRPVGTIPAKITTIILVGTETIIRSHFSSPSVLRAISLTFAIAITTTHPIGVAEMANISKPRSSAVLGYRKKTFRPATAITPMDGTITANQQPRIMIGQNLGTTISPPVKTTIHRAGVTTTNHRVRTTEMLRIGEILSESDTIEL